MGANLPGQSVFSWGHASQVASCGSHSGGHVGTSFFRHFSEPAACDGPVSIDTAVAQERPVAAHFVRPSRVVDSATRISSLSVEASAISWPNGIGYEETEPQNSRPRSGGPSKPTRLTAAT